MRILIVTGEASGDLHGAHLAKAIMALDPKAELVGIGGAAMRAAGVSLVPGVPQLDVMGLIGLSAIRAMVQRVRAVRRVLKANLPDVKDSELDFRTRCAAGMLNWLVLAPVGAELRNKSRKQVERLLVPVLAGAFGGAA